MDGDARRSLGHAQINPARAKQQRLTLRDFRLSPACPREGGGRSGAGWRQRHLMRAEKSAEAVVAACVGVREGSNSAAKEQSDPPRCA